MRAITELVIHAEPLSQKVMMGLLPQMQQAEKNSVETASSHFYAAARLSDRISFLLFLLSVLTAVPSCSSTA